MTENHDLYISYSSKKAYLTCPRQYWYMYVSKEKGEFDAKNSLFGNSIGKLFEWFYNKKLWIKSDVKQHLIRSIEIALDESAGKDNFDLKSDLEFKAKITQELQDCVISTLEIIRKYKLIAPVSNAEVKLNTIFKTKDLILKLGGRADFVHYFDKNNIWILDGKGSKHREKYIDINQLVWYAVQHYLKYHIVPNRLGFIFYKFPQDPITWISLTDQLMRSVLDETVSISKQIISKQFSTTPSVSCRNCPFKSKCNDGQKFLSNRKNHDGPVTSGIFDLEMV